MLINQLQEKFPHLPDLRVRDIRVDKSKRKVICALSYPNSADLAPAIKSNITAYVRGCVPKGYSCDVRFFNDIFTELSFRKYLFEYLKRRYPAFEVSKERTEIHQNERNITVTFNVSSMTKRNLEVANFCEDLTAYFTSYTCYSVLFTIRVDTNIVDKQSNVFDQEKLVRIAINKELMKPLRCFSVSNVEKYIGKLISNHSPMYIGDIRGEMSDCVLCGRVSAKTLRVSKTDSSLYICKFSLSDDAGGTIPCMMFVRFQITDVKTLKETTGKTDSEVLTISKTKSAANDRKMKKLMNIYDGMEVLVHGKISFNDYTNNLEMIVYDLCLCKIDSNSGKLKYISAVPENYMLLQPEKFDDFLQTSMEETIIKNEQFNAQKYVVLHANATGSNPAKDKIVSICAVKIEYGIITERIFTYVNPEVAITDELEREVRTDKSKLMFLHTLTELIPDLYKFTYGYTLVGMDISKLVAMLDYYAEPFGYKFTNSLVEQSDVLYQLFDSGLFKRVPNTNKLVEIARACKIPFEMTFYCYDTANMIAKSMVIAASRFRG